MITTQVTEDGYFLINNLLAYYNEKEKIFVTELDSNITEQEKKDIFIKKFHKSYSTKLGDDELVLKSRLKLVNGSPTPVLKKTRDSVLRISLENVEKAIDEYFLQQTFINERGLREEFKMYLSKLKI